MNFPIISTLFIDMLSSLSNDLVLFIIILFVLPVSGNNIPSLFLFFPASLYNVLRTLLTTPFSSLTCRGVCKVLQHVVESSVSKARRSERSKRPCKRLISAKHDHTLVAYGIVRQRRTEKRKSVRSLHQLHISRTRSS
jgi:hypothetical protein